MLWESDVWREMERLRREMNGLVTGYNRAGAASTYPLLNVYDAADELVVTAELPGFTRDDVSIVFADGAITLSGERKQAGKVSEMCVVRQERPVGRFEKTLRIPPKVEQEKINASFVNGILTIRLPKAEEAKPKTITIQAQ